MNYHAKIVSEKEYCSASENHGVSVVLHTAIAPKTGDTVVIAKENAEFGEFLQCRVYNVYAFRRVYGKYLVSIREKEENPPAELNKPEKLNSKAAYEEWQSNASETSLYVAFVEGFKAGRQNA